MSKTGNTAAPNRREFLTLVWFGALALALLQFGRSVLQTANPHGLGSLLGGVIPFGTLAAAPAADDPPLDDPENRTWLVNTGDGLLALDKTCTHLDCLLAWDNQDREFYCPCHGSRFSVDGEYLSGPAPRGMDRFVVQLVGEDEVILAATETSSGAPLALAYGISDELQTDEDSAEATEPAVDGKEPAEVALLSSDDILIQVDKSHRIPGAQPL